MKGLNNVENKSSGESEDQQGKDARWGRQMDIFLFETIREMQKAGQLDLQRVLNMEISFQGTNFPEVIALVEKFGWKGLRKHLVKRIQHLCKREMSVREIKLFKKLVKRDYKNKKVNFDKLLYHFPGKTQKMLEDIYSELKF